MNSKNIMKVLAIAGLASASFVAGIAVAKGPGKPPELSNLSEAKWTPLMKEGPLPALAPIQGDLTKGGGMAYLKLPAGFESPAHAHSSEYWTVLVQGKMTHWAAEGGSEKDAKPLAVGDLTHMPAKTMHVSKCYPGEECIMVLMQKGKFDFIPAPAPKK
jgi:quercetin dioxygenase-like cupin family protein